MNADNEIIKSVVIDKNVLIINNRSCFSCIRLRESGFEEGVTVCLDLLIVSL